MAWIAAAVIGAGALSAGSSYLGSQNAADAQSDAANASIGAQRDMFNTARGELQPFIDAGAGATGKAAAWNDFGDTRSPIAQLLNLTLPGSNASAALEQTPGYKFSLEQGQKAVTSGLAARGLAGPGGALAKGSANYAEGLAGTTWQSVVNALLGTYQAGGNALQSMVNTGASAAGSLGNNAVTTGQGIGNATVGLGNAQAAGAIGQANAVGGLGNSVSNATLLSKLLPQANNSAGGLYGGGG